MASKFRQLKWYIKRLWWRVTGHIHTDRELLGCIYEMYLPAYLAKVDRSESDRSKAAPLLQVDLYAIASTLDCSPHMLFGRLYHDMGARLRHLDPTDPKVTKASIFEPMAGSERHVVNVPYLTAVLAGLNEQRRRDLWTVLLSVIAIVVSVGSAILQHSDGLG